MIEIDRLSKTFRSRDGADVVALKNISLAVRDHEFITLVGASGCGKSTLLRLVAGLLPPTAGAISIDGKPVSGPRRDIGMVFQSPTLLPWATILDNVLFPLKLTHQITEGSREKARHLIALAGLSG